MRGTKSALSSLMMAAALAILAASQHAAAQTPLGSTFTYQGELTDGGTPVNGTVDLTFRLYDAVTRGNLIGTDTVPGVTVTDGRLTTTVDFSVGAFNGDRRWLEIDVDATTLGPRQEITVAPYALQTRGIFVDQDQNVGIGTTDPQRLLTIVDEEPVIGTTVAIKVFRPSQPGQSSCPRSSPKTGGRSQRR